MRSYLPRNKRSGGGRTAAFSHPYPPPQAFIDEPAQTTPPTTMALTTATPKAWPPETLTKSSPTPLSPAHTLALVNLCKQRDDAPHLFTPSLAVISIKKMKYIHPTDDLLGKVTLESTTSHHRILPSNIGVLCEDKKTGGVTCCAYAISHYASITRTQVTPPPFTPMEAIESKSFRWKMDAMARNPAQTSINPERGRLPALLDRRSRKKRAEGFGAQRLGYSRMLLVGMLKERAKERCASCMRKVQCKECRVFSARLDVLEGKGREEEECAVESTDDNEREDSDESSGSSASSSSDEQANAEAERATEREKECERERQALQEARDKAEREREKGKDRVEKRTLYAQMMIRGTASWHGRVGGILAPSRW
ncbi:hypothetical protein K458DRAFT_98792 [Lentithecium fluviatile CBS 122367]|uniref:Uncharacterized protein n=1 Tax=Lentithecium fluviatile CBS 122367 TaxID=1168545 RepID=A0A6G1JHR5_9PLEO|nr:hypothetical protein K458DRAFT_98792 [Lentithecium fluviatile CBS 122367]